MGIKYNIYKMRSITKIFFRPSCPLFHGIALKRKYYQPCRREVLDDNKSLHKLMKLEFKTQKSGEGNVEIDLTVSSLPGQLKDSDTKKLYKFLEDYIHFFMERSPN